MPLPIHRLPHTPLLQFTITLKKDPPLRIPTTILSLLLLLALAAADFARVAAPQPLDVQSLPTLTSQKSPTSHETLTTNVAILHNTSATLNRRHDPQRLLTASLVPTLQLPAWRSISTLLAHRNFTPQCAPSPQQNPPMLN